MAVISSRDGDYGPGNPFAPHDLLKPYLKTVFGFVGVTGIEFIDVQPMDAMGREMAQVKINIAQELVRDVAWTFLTNSTEQTFSEVIKTTVEHCSSERLTIALQRAATAKRISGGKLTPCL